MTLGQEAYELYVQFEKERVKDMVHYRPTWLPWIDLDKGYQQVWEQLAQKIVEGVSE